MNRQKLNSDSDVGPTHRDIHFIPINATANKVFPRGTFSAWNDSNDTKEAENDQSQ